MFLANKRRGEEKDRKREQSEREKEIRFEETLDNYNLHAHNEWRHDASIGPLHAENIRFPRRRNG